MNIYHTHKAKNVTSYDKLSPLFLLAPILGHGIRLSSFSEESGWTLSDILWGFKSGVGVTLDLGQTARVCDDKRPPGPVLGLGFLILGSS